MAMVATIFPGDMQPHYHLVPPPIFAQVLGKAREVTFGQPFQLLHHLLALVHGVKAMDPKHDLDLDFQGQHATKRFALGIDQPSSIHVDSAKHGMGPLCSGLPYFMGSLDQSPTRARTWSPTQKSVPMGGTP